MCGGARAPVRGLHFVQPIRSLSSMANGLPISIRTFFARHFRPSASASRASYEPVVTPVTFTRSSCSTAPSGSFAHWFGPNAVVPEGASSSDFTVDVVRFQKRVSLAIAGLTRSVAARASRLMRLMTHPRSAAGLAGGKAHLRPPNRRTQRLGLAAAFAVLTFGVAQADPLEVKVGVLRVEHSRETISILDIPAPDDFVAGAKLAIADNNTTGT